MSAVIFTVHVFELGEEYWIWGADRAEKKDKIPRKCIILESKIEKKSRKGLINLFTDKTRGGGFIISFIPPDSTLAQDKHVQLQYIKTHSRVTKRRNYSVGFEPFVVFNKPLSNITQ